MTCSSSCRSAKLRTRSSETMSASSEVSLLKRQVVGPGEERRLRAGGNRAPHGKAEVEGREGGGASAGGEGLRSGEPAWGDPFRWCLAGRGVTARPSVEAKPPRGGGRRREPAHVLAGTAGGVPTPVQARGRWSGGGAP